MTAERAYWLAWSRISGVGPILLQRLKHHFGDLSTAWTAPPSELGQVEGIGLQTLEQIITARQTMEPLALLLEHERANPTFWTPGDDDYPQLLLEIPSPPPVLYYQGQVQPQEIRGTIPVVAIVGTREPSDYGRRWTRRISTTLAKNGFIVASGLAEGIDTEAHTACLEAGGRTIAVLGTGVDVIYPRRNQQLYQNILKNGWVCSEYPAGSQPERSHFPQRNRIIAGLSRAILILEAPTKSGALITAHQANDFGRDVYVLPGSLDNKQSMGCLGLISKGAQIILGEGHLLELLGAMPPLDAPLGTPLPLDAPLDAPLNRPLSFTPPQSARPTPDLESPLAEIFRAIALEDTPSLDQIVQQTELDTGTVSSGLLQLELMGLVVQLPGMRYQRS